MNIVSVGSVVLPALFFLSPQVIVAKVYGDELFRRVEMNKGACAHVECTRIDMYN